MGGAVGAAALHPIGQVARGQSLDALVCHGRAQAVPANAFQTGTVAGRYADVRVRRETLDAGAAWTMHWKVKAGTAGRLKSSRVEPLEGVVVEAALGWIDAPEEKQGLAGDLPVDGLHLLIAGRRQGKERGTARWRRLGSEEAVGHEAMEMNIETKRAREALDRLRRTALLLVGVRRFLAITRSLWSSSGSRGGGSSRGRGEASRHLGAARNLPAWPRRALA
jgi:hypothetical protein